MKHSTQNLYVLFLSLLYSLGALAQAPQAFSYQAVAIGNDGTVLADQSIAVQANIISNSSEGNIVYSETHTITTTSAGLFTLEIGLGTSTGTLADVNWSSTAHFLEIAIDENNGNDYQSIGITQLLSVPYALYAEGTAGPVGPQGDSGPQGDPGVQGPEGPQGATGAQGPQGPAGANGANGAQGQEGPQGPTGAAGPSGPAGPTGAQGPPGPEGAQGPQGDPGPQGPAGPPGGGTNCWDTNNNLVNDSNEDLNNDDLFSALDCIGVDGAQGPAGPAGPTGPTGANGQGFPGPAGPPGANGVNGADGAAGAQGPVGPAGATGPAGAEGPAGPQGAQGPQGPQGETGPQGISTSWTQTGTTVYYNGGDVGIGTDDPACKLDVSGDVCSNGVVLSSDARYKKDIVQLALTLDKINALRGVRYHFDNEAFPEKNFPKTEQIGLIAQEVEALFPELVTTKPDGYKAVDYAKLTPILLEAIKLLAADLDVERTDFDDQFATIQKQINSLQSTLQQHNIQQNTIQQSTTQKSSK